MREILNLKKSNCKNCYKCIRHCPVKSIRISNNQAHIITSECILCGQCFLVCPQNAKQLVDDTERIKQFIREGEMVIASIAPSFLANFDNISMASMEQALKRLGFFAAEETALGATIVKREYERLIFEEKQDIILSSCCPSINFMIQKHMPDALKYLAKTITPMQAHCRSIKSRYPQAKTIFIGPCISKKAEADSLPEEVDCVLTFSDLSHWLLEENIAFEILPEKQEIGRSRRFPISGGIIKSMTRKDPEYTYLNIDGINHCINALKDIIHGEIHKCFIEMSACQGSCSNGPAANTIYRTPIYHYQMVDQSASENDFKIEQPPKEMLQKNHPFLGTNKQMPGFSELEELLKKMAKGDPENILNCGSCGYETCREKAIAVYQGKADISMCLPFIKDRAESFSGNIINHNPNAILVLSETLEIQQMNKAAYKMFGVRQGELLGEQVIRLFDPKDFLAVLHNGKQITDQPIYLERYQKHAEQTIIYDKTFHILVCIMRDITDEITERKKKEKNSRHTIEITDKVIAKQMRIVQEIASLLGETTAETKIALTKLKESLNDE